MVSRVEINLFNKGIYSKISAHLQFPKCKNSSTDYPKKLNTINHDTTNFSFMARQCWPDLLPYPGNFCPICEYVTSIVILITQLWANSEQVEYLKTILHIKNKCHIQYRELIYLRGHAINACLLTAHFQHYPLFPTSKTTFNQL